MTHFMSRHEEFVASRHAAIDAMAPKLRHAICEWATRYELECGPIELVGLTAAALIADRVARTEEDVALVLYEAGIGMYTDGDTVDAARTMAALVIGAHANSDTGPDIATYAEIFCVDEDDLDRFARLAYGEF